MPSNVGSQVAARMQKIGLEVQRAERTAISKAAAEAKKIHLAEMRAASGGDLVLSKVGKKGGKIGVRTNTRKAGQDMTALVAATGPLQLLEHKSRPHLLIPHSIGRAKGRTRAARHAAKQELYTALFGTGGFAGAKPLRMPWGPRFSANHPGVQKPKRPWAKALKKSAPAVERIMRATYADAFKRGATK